MKAVPLPINNDLPKSRFCGAGELEAIEVKMPDISLLCPEAQKIAQLKISVGRDDCNSL
jgi:hypothetical protein